MDQRGRPAESRYRERGEKKYITITLSLQKKIIVALEKAVKKTENKNMSSFIEETVTNANKDIEKMPKRRKFKENQIIKKTFTFTPLFVEKIQKTGNMSLYIENILIEKLI